MFTVTFPVCGGKLSVTFTKLLSCHYILLRKKQQKEREKNRKNERKKRKIRDKMSHFSFH